MSSINGERMQPLTPEILKGRLMLRVREYAELTGTPIPSVYRYLALGKLPGIRIGNRDARPIATARGSGCYIGC